jgi:hypothetical protein
VVDVLDAAVDAVELGWRTLSTHYICKSRIFGGSGNAIIISAGRTECGVWLDWSILYSVYTML